MKDHALQLFIDVVLVAAFSFFAPILMKICLNFVSIV